jgi:predicted permease
LAASNRIPGVRRVFRFPWRTARAVERDIDEEIAFHLDMRAAELRAGRGLSEGAARAEALRQFGDLEDARRYIRRMDQGTETSTRRRELMSDFTQDLRQGVRALLRTPGFTLIAVLALALGIGATTSIFTLVNAILLRPLAVVAHPEQLVAVGNPGMVGAMSFGSARTDLFSVPLYRDLRDRSRTVSGLLASGRSNRLDVVIPDSGRSAAAGAAEPEHPRGRLVSGNYFAVLGVPAVAGRTFTMEEDRGPGSGPVAVIAHGYWKRRFGMAREAIGQTILVNRTPITIVGVAPPDFVGEIVGGATDIWLPMTMQPLIIPGSSFLEDRSANWLLLMGRLRPDATLSQAATEFNGIARQSITAGASTPDERAALPRVLEDPVPVEPGGRGFSRVRQNFRGPLALLMAATGLVLLIVCANVANLMLARAAARHTEIGVRLALGAGRGRLVRQLLTESLALGFAGGALGVLFAWWGSTLLLRATSRGSSPVPLDTVPDLRVLAFAALLSLATTLLFGLLPAARATRVELATTLRAHARGLSGSLMGGSGRRLGLGKLLVIAQVALSLVLLIGAGLLVRSARNLQRADVGMARDELLIVQVDLQTGGVEPERSLGLVRELTERVGRVPGVRAVTYSENGIFSGTESNSSLQVSGFVAKTAEDSIANSDQVGPNYFTAIGAHLLRGREIGPQDVRDAPRVAVVNESFARFYFAGREAVGQRLQVDSNSFEVVGVAPDFRNQSLREPPVRRFYTAIAQNRSGPGYVVLEVRTAGDPARVANAVRREILAADSRLRVLGADPLTVLMRDSIAQERLVARLASVAGGMALVLAALGLYGVMTYTIVRRTGEFGLRMALGARPWDVTRMVLRETMLLFVVGVAVGIPVALGAVRMMKSQLVGVGLLDPVTLAVALVVLGGSALFAGYRPASRAARVAPQEALRRE